MTTIQKAFGCFVSCPVESRRDKEYCYDYYEDVVKKSIASILDLMR
jgi:hypothetical protein